MVPSSATTLTVDRLRRGPASARGARPDQRRTRWPIGRTFWDRAGKDAVAPDRRHAAGRQLRADARLRLHPGRRRLGGALHRARGQRVRPRVAARPAAGRGDPGGRDGVGPLAGARVLRRGPPRRVRHGRGRRAGVGERAGLGLAVRRARGSDVRSGAAASRSTTRSAPAPMPSAWPPSMPHIRCTSSTSCRRSRSAFGDHLATVRVEAEPRGPVRPDRHRRGLAGRGLPGSVRGPGRRPDDRPDRLPPDATPGRGRRSRCSRSCRSRSATSCRRSRSRPGSSALPSRAAP